MPAAARPAVEAASFRFERCEVRLASREIVLDGRAQQLEPRPFDLLVYLIEQRDRVVSKDELLDKLWPDEFVSGSVIARAVMKARQAIGDDGKVARIIKTVRGTGYRFVSKVTTQAPAPAPSASARGLNRREPLVLLPFENRTGETDLDWVELGLMSMVAKALSTDTRLRLPELPSLLTALDTLPPGASPRARMDVAQRLLGARHVVYVAVSREHRQYVLDYEVSEAPVVRQRLVGPELTQLGQRLALALEVLLFDGEAASPAVAYESADPLVNQALARALQATGQQQWRTAVNLFRVVLDVEPLNTDAQLEYLRALAFLGDEAALAVGERLLAQAQATQHHRLAIAVHEALATTYNNRLSHQATRHAKQHLHEALRLAEEHGLMSQKKSALRTLMGIAIHERDFACARQCLDGMESLHVPDGDVVDHARFLGSSAIAATAMDEPQRGLQIFRTVVGLAEQHRLHDLHAMTLVNIIYPCIDLGLLSEAARHGETALAVAQSVRNIRVAVAATERLCLLYRERRATQQMYRVLAQAAHFETTAPVKKAMLLLADGHQAACEGAHQRAVETLNQALAIYRESEAMLYVHDVMPWLVISLVLAGQIDEAEATCAQARSLPDFDGNAALRAALRYGDALIAHTRGQHQEARRCLRDVEATAPMGLWRAHAGLSGAWLAVEAGDLDAAGSLLAGLGPWLQEHPVGAAVEARFRYATGEYTAAQAAQQRYAASIGTPLPDYYAKLARLYDEAAAHAPASQATIEPIPFLPTTL